MNRNNLALFILLTVFSTAMQLHSSDLYSCFNGNTDSVEAKVSANDQISNSRTSIITQTVKKVSSAVVGINVTAIQEYQNPAFSPFFNDPFFRQFFGNQTYSQKVKSLGSGFLISKDGYIVTNDHVAGSASEILVTLTNGKHYNAKVVGTDAVSDICLLKIEGENFPHLKFGNSSDVMIGEWAIALGNPFGLFELNNKPTVTVGVISATGMNLNQVQNRYYFNMIQTDAAINGGNSGGPLVNAVGEVIGMNTIIFTSGGSEGSIGLGFAIPINKISNIIRELIDKGKIEREFNTGLSVQNIDESIAKYFKLESTKGIIVTKVLKNSPAARAGVKEGDVILKVDDYNIDNEQTIIGVLQEFRTNQTVTLKVLRDEKEISLPLKLENIK